jgi:steroid delta-isomerase-like uncharacterized protein
VGSPQDNKALVQRFLDALSSGDVAGAAACFDADRYYSHAHEADLAGTWERMKAARRARALTDFESTTVALLADGDRVVHHATVRATHAGEFLGLPGSGRRFEFTFIETWRIDGDKIVEHWGGLHEMTRLYAQLAGAES